LSNGYVEFLVDQLAARDVSARRMFGGAGLFRDGLMFALVADDELYLKVDDSSRPAFEALGLTPFRYRRKGRPIALKSYYRAPEGLVDDPDELVRWADAAWEAALRAGQRGDPA
jgi:DNA transformation protein